MSRTSTTPATTTRPAHGLRPARRRPDAAALALALGLGLGLPAGPAAADPPVPQTATIGYAGVLEKDGAPFAGGAVTMGWRLFDAPAGGTLLGVGPFEAVSVDPDTGVFQATPDFEAWPDPDAPGTFHRPFDGRPLWIETVVAQGGTWVTLPDRTFLPAAAVAAHADPASAPWFVDGAGNVIAGTGTSQRVGINNADPERALDVRGFVRTDVLEIVGGSDIAEPFDVDGEPRPGMVVRIDDRPGRVGELRVADAAYDRAVAGVVSGANGVRPGLTLTQPGTDADGELPVALAGRVWVLVDADAGGPVVAGDLLTTSATPGHAMKVGDRDRANGAILGKAMSSLESGRGLVLVLVNLQ